MKLVLAYIVLTAVTATFAFSAPVRIEPGISGYIASGIVLLLGVVLGRISLMRGVLVVAILGTLNMLSVFVGFTFGVEGTASQGSFMTLVYILGFYAGVTLLPLWIKYYPQ